MEPTTLPRVLAVEHPIPTVLDRVLHTYVKRPFPYDESCERFQRATRYKRHLYPWEGAQVLLNPEKYPAAEDMRRGLGEWYHMAWELREGTLTTFTDPENLCSCAGGYAVIGGQVLSAAERAFEFPFGNGTPVLLRDIHRHTPDLVEHLWGKEFSMLPEVVQRDGYILPPPEGKAMPLGRSNDWYGIDSVGQKASRGTCLERAAPKVMRASVQAHAESYMYA